MTLPTLTGPMTPLQAVNICLVAAALSPIVTDTVIEQNVAGYSAWLLILEESRQVQSKGWHFNTNYDFILEPNSAGEIILPDGYMKVRIPGGRYIKRGSRLYDRIKNTYQFTQSITAQQIVVILDWDDLPQQAHYYIAVRAARRYAATRASAQAVKQYSEMTEMDALVSLEQADTELGEPNSIHHSEHTWTWKNKGRR